MSDNPFSRARLSVLMASNTMLKEQVKQQSETIKGLDRATVEYTRIIAEKDKRISDLLEADAGRPVRDTNGTIEAQANRIRNLEAVIKQYRTEMQALQAKLFEYERRMDKMQEYQTMEGLKP